MKNEKGFAALLVMFAIWLVIMPALILDWVIVDVKTCDKDNVHIIVPVPLQLAGIALSFIPKEDLNVTIPKEVQDNKELITRLFNELKDSPDATLVSVKSNEAQVTISKKGNNLTIDVIAPDAKVHGILPLKETSRMFETWDGQHIQPQLAIKLLADCHPGSILSIDSKEARVHITKW
jgi:hypothetical protein